MRCIDCRLISDLNFAKIEVVAGIVVAHIKRDGSLEHHPSDHVTWQRIRHLPQVIQIQAVCLSSKKSFIFTLVFHELLLDSR